MPPVLELIQSGKFEPRLVTDSVLPWHEAAEALPELREKLVFTRA
jgi:hypothetical protein